jgi:hypothetical protein
MMRTGFILFCVFIMACRNEQNKSISKVTLPANDTIIVNNIVEKEEVCQGYHTYDSCTIVFYKETVSQNPNLSGLASFRFFFKNKKNWDANKPLALKLGLPLSAVIIEKAKINDSKNRQIILWMDNPKITYSEYTFTCGERTSGVGQFIGMVNLSLVNSEADSIINTLSILDYDGVKPDRCYLLPYLFYTNDCKYYTFSPSGYKGYSKVQLINFEDHNGDGSSNEFCMYYQSTCSFADKTMFSYDSETDSLYNYVINSTTNVYDSLGNLDTIFSDKNVWVDRDFKYPSENIPKEFAIGGYMTRGDGLPVYNTSFNKKSKEINSKCNWYDFKYANKYEEQFDKYFQEE